MFENIKRIFKKAKNRELLSSSSKDTAKERLHLVLMQDRANVSADFLDLMREEIIEVIKKYIDIDEDAMDVRLTNETNSEGIQGVPALYANIPIINIKDEARKANNKKQVSTTKADKTETEDDEKIQDSTEEMSKKENNLVEQEDDTKKEENNKPETKKEEKDEKKENKENIDNKKNERNNKEKHQTNEKESKEEKKVKKNEK